MTDWADEKVGEWYSNPGEGGEAMLNDPALSSLAALLRDVAGEGSIGLGVAMGRAEAQAEIERLSEQLRLCTVPDGWETWRRDAEAKLAEARATKDMHKERQEEEIRIRAQAEAKLAEAQRVIAGELGWHLANRCPVEKLREALDEWKRSDSAPDCVACAVLDAALAASPEQKEE